MQSFTKRSLLFNPLAVAAPERTLLPKELPASQSTSSMNNKKRRYRGQMFALHQIDLLATGVTCLVPAC